ncbi:O-antigen polymerase [Cytobacillus sp. OWB-43]|uniref:O-antigen polymerase n=1 Tax=Cytobacillus sp. OWB-43 TaxID=3108468 RepID=UPI002AFDFF5A|nr:O-antigen polymerase [Cytobacillus sp. OWB-43]MEA1853616.1 O-antigen polymerase [Cytobacillus sp. OWB-43]
MFSQSSNNKSNSYFFNRSIKSIILLCFIYIFLLMNYYYVIADVYSYLGHTDKYFSFNKLFISLLITFILINLSLFIRRDFYKIIYSVTIVLYFFGQSINYIYNDSAFVVLLSMTVPLIGIFIADKIDGNRTIKRTVIDLNDKITRIFIVVLIIITVVPFFKYIGTVNLSNLLLIDIYSTREEMRQYDRGILGYLFSPLSRIVLPFLFVYGIIKKRMILIAISLLCMISMFLLNGAVKSIFFGILCAAFFIKGNYKAKEKRFLHLILWINVVGFMSFFIFNSTMINDYIRRLFITPASLFDIYYKYFNGNYTYYTHSDIYSILTRTENNISISRYIGEYVMGREGLNANTGIFVEGFISFGILGVIIFSLIFMLILIFLRKMNFISSYFGIIFVYIYVINTSFFETLLITHGLMFFLIFSFLFFQENGKGIQKE